MITVQGIIKDETGQGLPYANVFFSDRQGNILTDHQGAATGENGNYSIQGNGAYITASYTGFEKQTKPFGRTVDFTLGGGVELKEVEIIGNRPQSKKTPANPLKWVFIAVLAIVLVTVLLLQYKSNLV